MLINQGNLNALFQGFNTSFNKGVSEGTTHHKTVAMVVPSTAADNTYAWLGQFPRMQEWIGDRILKNLAAHSYAVANRKFEMTIPVPRTKIEDDQYGLFAPLFQEIGKSTTEHPDELVFELLSYGFTTACYDGKPFFAVDHPVADGDGGTAAVSNMQDGASPMWVLMDCSRAIKPLLFQNRIPYTFTRLDRDNDPNVFWQDEFIYGVRARANAGFGLWQLAFASKADLTAENYEAARQAIMGLKGDGGRPLNLRPDTLVVGPSLEGDALRLVNSGSRVVTVDNGAGAITPVSVTNEWAGTAKPIVSAWLA